jgi:hypothetical protein
MPTDPMTAIGCAIEILAADGSPEAVLVGEGLKAWSRLRNATLEEAAGWASNVRATSMQRARDAALQRLGRRFLARSGRGLAETVHTAVARYRPRYPRDAAAGHRPDGIAGDCFDALVNGNGKLPCVGHLRAILAMAD